MIAWYFPPLIHWVHPSWVHSSPGRQTYFFPTVMNGFLLWFKTPVTNSPLHPGAECCLITSCLYLEITQSLEHAEEPAVEKVTAQVWRQRASIPVTISNRAYRAPSLKFTVLLLTGWIQDRLCSTKFASWMNVVLDFFFLSLGCNHRRVKTKLNYCMGKGSGADMPRSINFLTPQGNPKDIADIFTNFKW